MILSIFRNEKGVALISVYVVSAFLTIITASAFSRAFVEKEYVEKEIERMQTFAAAEAGIQQAMWQISQNAYTGFIDTADISTPSFTSYSGVAIGNYSVDVSYPNQADWVIVKSTATVQQETRILEARIFLDSNLSKFLVYANTGTFSSGNAQYGSHNGADPNGVPADGDDRTMMYFTGTWDITGSGMEMYGDVNAENYISGSNANYVYGDVYSGSYTENNNGVTNDGVNGSLQINDGFADDLDRNKDGVVNTVDRPDHHDLNQYGNKDHHKTEDLVNMNLSFYAANNNIPSFSSGAAQTRYLKFVVDPGATTTKVVAYTNKNFSTVSSTHTLPQNAIVYVKGNAYIQGEIEGRVAVASSDDIMLVGNLTYTDGQSTADATHSAAFLAKDKLYFMANDLEASGILYAENSSNSSAAFDANYNINLQNDSSSKERLRLYGNRVLNGSTNLSYYDDRVYGYDPNLKYYRPPGIPVVPTIKTVREVDS